MVGGGYFQCEEKLLCDSVLHSRSFCSHVHYLFCHGSVFTLSYVRVPPALRFRFSDLLHHCQCSCFILTLFTVIAPPPLHSLSLLADFILFLWSSLLVLPCPVSFLPLLITWCFNTRLSFNCSLLNLSRPASHLYFVLCALLPCKP